MAKETFELARIASAEEVASYLEALAAGLQGGEVVLESGHHSLRLHPTGDLKLEIAVKNKDDKGKISIELGWKRRREKKTPELRVEAGRRSSG